MTATLDPPRSPASGLTIIRKDAWLPADFQHKLKTWSPKSDLGRYVRYIVVAQLPPQMAAELIEKFSSICVLQSALRGRHWNAVTQRWEDHGLLSEKVITTTGVGFLVDAWQNSVELENMKYHGVGTGTNTEAAAETALATESTTALNPDSTRATGSLTEGASGNIFRSVGTPAFDATAAIIEHGLFSQAATGGGVMWDRSQFSAINVVSGDSIQFTYDMTASAGG